MHILVICSLDETFSKSLSLLILPLLPYCMQPKTTARPLNVKSATALDDDNPWAAIAAPPPTTGAKPLVLVEAEVNLLLQN